MIVPRIERIELRPRSRLRMKFRDGHWHEANLSGFVARYPALAPLKDPQLFRKAKVIDWGAAVGWPGELDSGARTLLRLAEEQSGFSNAAFRAWQSEVRLTNKQAANALGVSLATVKNYRSKAGIPSSIAIACRTMKSEPAVLAAHLAEPAEAA